MVALLGKRDKVDGERLGFIPPQMPTLVEQPPEDDGWVHEVKLDGYRTQIIIDKGGVRLYSKNGRDWTTKYWPIALVVDLPCRAAILDGEVIVSGEQGTPDSAALEAAIWNEPSGLVFVAFDLLHLDGGMLGKEMKRPRVELDRRCQARGERPVDREKRPGEQQRNAGPDCKTDVPRFLH
jgi:ATP-dependent DNA ligase